jgi:hypothetical protein
MLPASSATRKRPHGSAGADEGRAKRLHEENDALRELLRAALAACTRAAAEVAAAREALESALSGGVVIDLASGPASPPQRPPTVRRRLAAKLDPAEQPPPAAPEGGGSPAGHGRKSVGSRPQVSSLRKPSERAKLPGETCRHCEAFFRQARGAVDAETAALLEGGELCQHASRHRFAQPAPTTPPGYWSVDSPPVVDAAAAPRPAESQGF